MNSPFPMDMSKHPSPYLSNERGLFSYLKRCNLKVKFLFQHTPRGRLQSSPETRDICRHYLHVPSLALLQDASITNEQACVYIWHPGFCSHHSGICTPWIAWFLWPTPFELKVPQDYSFSYPTHSGSVHRGQTEMHTS